MKKLFLTMFVLTVALSMATMTFSQDKENDNKDVKKEALEWSKELLSEEQIEAAKKAGVAPAIEIPLDKDGKVIVKMIFIPPGEFEMGSNVVNAPVIGGLPGEAYEKPVHKVKIDQGFYMAITEVTQAQWKAVMGENPSSMKGDNKPIEMVSWDDAKKFLEKVNASTKDNGFALPSEAQWEYSCKAGTKTPFSFPDHSKYREYAWNTDNSEKSTHEVGKKKPNPWGLFDMHGNVWEWCEDNWHPNYEGAPSDGKAWKGDDKRRVLRGGGWYSSQLYICSTARYKKPTGQRYGGFGFRIIKTIEDLSTKENPKVQDSPEKKID